MGHFIRYTTQSFRFGHMTLPFQAQDAYGVLRILCKHFGKFPGQTLPLRWLILEWRSGARLGTASVPHRAQPNLAADESTVRVTNVPIPETDLHVAIEYAIHSGWLVRHTAGDEAVIELTKAGYQRYSDQEAITALGKSMPRELIKLLKKRG